MSARALLRGGNNVGIREGWLVPVTTLSMKDIAQQSIMLNIEIIYFNEESSMSVIENWRPMQKNQLVEGRR